VKGGGVEMEEKPRRATFVAVNCRARHHHRLLAPAGAAFMLVKAGAARATMPDATSTPGC
jgi:hypothetical protein